MASTTFRDPCALAALLLSAACLAGCGAAPAVAERRSPPDRISALGRLEPAGDIINVSGPAGARVDHFGPGVREGAHLNAGDPVAFFDTYDEALAARDQAASQLAEATAQRRAEQDAGSAAVDDANLQIRHANQSLPLQIAAQEAELRRSTVDLDKLKGDLARAEKLHAGDAIVQSQYDAIVSAEKQAEALVARNQALLAQLQEDHRIQVEASQAALKSAEAGRTRGELSARVQSLTAALRMAEARLAIAGVRAPISGEVLQILTRPGEAIRNEPILKMGDTSVMTTIVDVYETDVRYVRAGQKATITSQALPQPLTGHVERVGSIVSKSDVLGTDPTAATDARTIEVRIRLDAPGAASRYNRHQVDVTIETAGEAAGTAAGAPAAAPAAPKK
jgi:HlyD family secretion protein